MLFFMSASKLVKIQVDPCTRLQILKEKEGCWDISIKYESSVINDSISKVMCPKDDSAI